MTSVRWILNEGDVCVTSVKSVLASMTVAASLTLKTDFCAAIHVFNIFLGLFFAQGPLLSGSLSYICPSHDPKQPFWIRHKFKIHNTVHVANIILCLALFTELGCCVV